MARDNVGQVSRSTSAALATAAIVCFAYSALALLLLHLLRPDYTPATNFISNYAVGRYGWIMTTWFLAMSCGLLTLAMGLYRNDLRSVGQVESLVATTAVNRLDTTTPTRQSAMAAFHDSQRRSSQCVAPVWSWRSTSSTASITACGLSN